jgi:hypothetical protein
MSDRRTDWQGRNQGLPSRLGHVPRVLQGQWGYGIMGAFGGEI